MESQETNQDKDPAYREFWADFHQAAILLKRGQIIPAMQLLFPLLKHPKLKNFDPGRNVEYTAAVTCLDIPNSIILWKEAEMVFRGLIDDAERGINKNIDNATVHVELAAALVLQNRFSEAEEVAKKALSLTESQSFIRGLAFYHLARARWGLGKTEASKEAFLEMMNVSLAINNLTQAGIGAEWLSRLILSQGTRELAATWLDLSQDVYRATATQFLESSADLVHKLFNQKRAPIETLPHQASALRLRISPAGEIGDWAGIHLDSLDVDLGLLWQISEIPSEQDIYSIITVPSNDTKVRSRVFAILASEVKAIIPHAWEAEVLTNIIVDLWPERASRILERLSKPDSFDWEYKTTDSPIGELVWLSNGAGPAAYRTILQELVWLFAAGYEGRKTTKTQISEGLMRDGFAPSSISQYYNFSDRSWPRPLHYWMILQGQAAVGGETGPIHLAEDAARLRLISSEENKNSFLRIGYAPAESEKLDRGGLIALLPSEIVVPGAPPPIDIGTMPLGEINAANPPLNIESVTDFSRPGFVLDREYNTWFYAPSPSLPAPAWYGASNILFRDHFDQFRSHFEITGSVRSKHYSIPIIEINSRQELARVVSLLNETAEWLKPTKHVEKDARVWFRGQRTPYFLKRTDEVNMFLYGRSDVVEPSLPGAAPRRNWNYHKIHSFLSVMLQAFLYRRGQAGGETTEKTRERLHAFTSFPGNWDLGVMLLAQHYGIPTPGIDITHDAEVALWFATHRFIPLGEGTAKYQRESTGWGDDSSKWPVIYAILPVVNSLKGAIREIDLLTPLGINALRPARQKAAFFMGATGLHRNRLAEALVCVLRLRPDDGGSWSSDLTYEHLFPKPQEDEVYSWMLEVKKKYTQYEIGKFLSEIPTYLY